MSLSHFDFLTKPLLRHAYKIKKTGFEKIDFSKPCILMPNHISMIDPFLLGTVLPDDEDIFFVAYTGAATKYASFMKGRKIVYINPLNPYSMRTIIKLIKEGKKMVIFPEGRISTTGNLMKIYPGVAYIALKTGIPVYPITLNGPEHSTFSYLKGKVKQRYFPPISIHVGDAFTIPSDPSLSMKVQKQKSSEMILHKLQNEKLKTELKTNVNLFNELLEVSKYHDSKTPIIEDINGTITYKKFVIASYIFSHKLKPILNDENHIGVFLPNSIGHAIALFSLFHLGKTPAILNFSMGANSLMECCETASVRTILTSRVFIDKGGFHAVAEELGKTYKLVYLEDIKNTVTSIDKLKGFFEFKNHTLSSYQGGSVIIFTSGSESKPKGVVLSHDNLWANMHQVKTVIDFTSKDKLMNVLPMFHSFGLTAGTLLPILFGIPLFLFPSPLQYKVIPELVYEKNATIMFGTSTFLEGYGKNAHDYDFYSLRYVFAGAEKLKEDVRNMWFDKFGIRIFEGYGTTETSPVLSLNTPLNYKRGTVGRFLPGVEYKIESIEGIETGGNLFVKGPNVMKGYLIHGKGFVPCEEWYNCGDVVEVDEDGYVTIKSRLKRFAKIAGEMVSLNLLEQVAFETFSHSNFYAVSISDKRKGEKIVLFTTEHQGEEKSILKELKKSISTKKLSSLLSPVVILHLDKVPVLGSGKTDYVSLTKVASEYKEVSLTEQITEQVKGFFKSDTNPS